MSHVLSSTPRQWTISVFLGFLAFNTARSTAGRFFWWWEKRWKMAFLVHSIFSAIFSWPLWNTISEPHGKCGQIQSERELHWRHLFELTCGSECECNAQYTLFYFEMNELTNAQDSQQKRGIGSAETYSTIKNFLVVDSHLFFSASAMQRVNVCVCECVRQNVNIAYSRHDIIRMDFAPFLCSSSNYRHGWKRSKLWYVNVD